MSLLIDRRDFIKQVAFATGALNIRIPSEDLIGNSSSTDDALFQVFTQPPAQARPFFRWWWNGNRITRDELIRELRLMKEVGAGGIEINPISMPESIPDPGGVPVEWLSDEWNQRVRECVLEAQNLGMITDLIVGTGWPFGGTFLEPQEMVQGLELEVRKFTGPLQIRERIFNPQDPDKRLLQVKLFPAPITDLIEYIDLTDRVLPDGHLVANIRNGDHVLYLLTWRNRFREVLHGAPGADGPVLDHFNRTAIEKYLDKVSDRLGPVLGERLGDGIRSMFCDSIELEGANWTSDLADEFKKRRGYDIVPHLSIVMHRDADVEGDAIDDLRRIRFDYSKTLAELFMERFIIPFHEWCHQNGTLSRYQAYGHPWLYTDLLDGYLVPDIPEGDQWLFNAGWVKNAILDNIRYAIWNKYASSGGHLKGRRIISSEAMTNTKGVFAASLEYIKQATDINFISGVNHLVLHGFNYSPPEAGIPGWVRFGTYFSEHNPWWPYARKWFDYASRLSALFQESEPVVQIAILGPTPDIWSDHGLDRNPWNTTPTYLHALWQALNHQGYCADYVNATVLQQAEYRDGSIHYGPMQYQVLILAGVETLEPTTAEALLHFAENGGRLLFIGNVPRRSPGLMNGEINDLKVRTAIETAFQHRPDYVHLVVDPGEEDLSTWAGKFVKRFDLAPAISISNPDPKLFFVQYRRESQDIFFLVNADRNRVIPFTAHFSTGEKIPWRWNAEDGTRTRFRNVRSEQGFEIELLPLESMLLVFEPGEDGDTIVSPERVDRKTIQEIDGPWQLELQSVTDGREQRLLNTLTDLATLPGLDHFSGVATYRTSFRITDLDNEYVLDLGRVHEIAEVFLNDRSLGTQWWGRRSVALGNAIVEGENVLEIQVSTLLFNYVRSLEDNPHARFWIEQNVHQSPLPSGLLGPVLLSHVT